MEIKRIEVMRRIGAESVASHYYSAAPSGGSREEVKRVPMVKESRYALIEHRVDEAMEGMLSRLWGWAESGVYEGGILTLNIKSAYLSREDLMRSAALEMIVAEVWRSIVGQQWPERAEKAQEQYERAEDRLMSVAALGV